MIESKDREKEQQVKQNVRSNILSKIFSSPVFRLDLEITERCNNNCIHCNINQPENDAKIKAAELSTDDLKKIISDAVIMGCIKLKLTGGEPLLREDFFDIYRFARMKGLNIKVFTNAQLISEEHIALFKKTPPGDTIEVTMYGLSRASYESVSRVKGSFERAKKGISKLIENKIPFIVKGTALPQTIGEIEAFDTWASTLPYMRKPPSYVSLLDMRGRRDDPKKNRLIKTLRLNPDEILTVLARQKKEYILEMAQFIRKFVKPTGDKIFSCGAGNGQVSVDAYGNLHPCLLLKDPETSIHLKTCNLKEAVTHFIPEIRQKKSMNPEYLKRCARCFLRGLCEQCPARSWTEHGTLDTPVNYYCDVAHKQAEMLGLLEPGEKAWLIEDWQSRITKPALP